MTDRRAVVTASLATLGVACLALPLSLFLLWYVPNGYAALLGAPSLTGWDAFRGLDAAFTLLGLLGAGAAAAGIVAGVRRNRPRIAGVAAAAGALCAEVVALALVVRRIAEPPGGTVAQQATTGAWLGVCCCVLAVLAAATAAIVAVRGPLTAPEPKAKLEGGRAADPVASDDVSVPAAVAPPPGHPRFPLVDGLRAIAVVAVVTGPARCTAGASARTRRPHPAPARHDRREPVLRDLGLPALPALLRRPALQPAALRGCATTRAGACCASCPRTGSRSRSSPSNRACRACSTLAGGATTCSSTTTRRSTRRAGSSRPGAWSSRPRSTSCSRLSPSASATWCGTGRATVPSTWRWPSWPRSRSARFCCGPSASTRAASCSRGSCPTYFLWFALGMSLAVITVHTPSWLRRGVAWIRTHPSWCWAAIVVPYAILVLWGPTDPLNIGATESFVGYLLAPVIACLIALPAIFDAGAGVPRAFLALRPVAWVGLVSYGIFLWQFGVIQQFDEWGWNTWFGNGNGFIPFTLVVLLALCVVAAFSYYVIERPFLSLKDRRRRRPSTTPLAAEPSTRSAGVRKFGVESGVRIGGSGKDAGEAGSSATCEPRSPPEAVRRPPSLPELADACSSPRRARTRASRRSARPSRASIATIRLPRHSGPARDLERAPTAPRRTRRPRAPPRAGRRRGRPRSRPRRSTAKTSSTTSRLSTAGTKPAPMPWILCGPGRAARQHRRGRRLDGDDVHVGVALLEHLAHAGDRAAGAHAGDERVHAAVERVEDLGRRRAPVDLRVGGVRELVGQEHVVAARRARCAACDRLVHAAQRLGDAHVARRTGAAAPRARGSCPAGSVSTRS